MLILNHWSSAVSTGLPSTTPKSSSIQRQLAARLPCSMRHNSASLSRILARVISSSSRIGWVLFWWALSSLDGSFILWKMGSFLISGEYLFRIQGMVLFHVAENGVLFNIWRVSIQNPCLVMRKAWFASRTNLGGWKQELGMMLPLNDPHLDSPATKTRPFWRIIDKVSTSMMRIIIIIIIMMVIQSPPTYMPLNLPIPSHCKTKKKESQLGGMPSWKARSSSTLRRSSISSLMVAIWISDAVCGRLTCPEQSGKVPQQHGQWRSMQITFKKCGKCTRVKFHTMQRIKSLFQLWNITLRQPSVDWKHVLNNQDTRT